ncbi:unnamed protein product, partial [Linum tenue]
ISGVDYISVGAYVEDGPAHLALLKSREIIVVEGMKLDDVEAGRYNVHCLPIRLVGADGAPARCILIKNKLYTTTSFESGGLEFKSF